MVIQEAKGVLADAEKSLRDLMQRELREQRYSELAELARMADTLARLARGISQPESANRQTAAPSNPSSPNPFLKTAGKPANVRASSKKSTAKRDYPRFERDDDKLVKVGWSKKAREEYEHRAPFDVAEALLAAVGKKHQPGELFAATDVLPLHDRHGDAIPDYQFYLVLKWLHCEGVVTKHGRDRYAIEPGRLDDEAIGRLWKGLPQFKGIST